MEETSETMRERGSNINNLTKCLQLCLKSRSQTQADFSSPKSEEHVHGMDTRIYCLNYTQDLLFFDDSNYDCYGLVALFGDNVRPSRKRKMDTENDATHLFLPTKKQKKNKIKLDDGPIENLLINRKAFVIKECPAEIWIADQDTDDRRESRMDVEHEKDDYPKHFVKRDGTIWGPLIW